MKFSNNAKEIINISKVNINSLLKRIGTFKYFCEDICNANAYTNEDLMYRRIHEKLNSMNLSCETIKDIIRDIEEHVNDKERASVMYPYEKQAIYQYLSKFDFEKHCPKKCGCIYAEKILKDGKEVITIGLSVCNDKDIFSKNIALNLAKKRAREYPIRYDIRVTPRPEKFPANDTLHIPYKWMYESEIAKFVKRCTRWFKNETIIYPNNIDFVEFPKKCKKKHEPTGEQKKMPF